MAEEAMTATRKLNGDTPEVNGLGNDDVSDGATKVQDTKDAVSANISKLAQETSSSKDAMQIDPEPTENAKGRRRKQSFGKATVVVPKSPRGIKRRADSSLSAKSDDEEEFTAFVDTGDIDKHKRLSEILDKMESQLQRPGADGPTPVKIRRKDTSPIGNRMTTPMADNSRPSSGLSQISEDLLAGGRSSSIEVTSSTTNSPVPGRGGRKSVVDLSNPLFRVPMEHGWKRELVYRAALDPHSRRTGDIYYYAPSGKKLRSSREVGEHLGGTGLTLDNFSFFKEALGLDDPEKEIIRDAKMQKGSPLSVSTPTWSPVAGNATPRVEGKRTPKPKVPKGASPDRGLASPKPKQAKLQVQALLGTAKNLHSIPKVDAPVKGKPAKKPAVITKISGSPRWSLNSSGGAGHQLILIRSPDGIYGVQSPPPLIPIGQTQSNRWQGREGAVGVAQCSLHCPGANGRVPNLQCSVCLCLFHPKCAGGTLKINTGFVCRACLSLSTSKTPPPPLTNMAALKPKKKSKDSTVRSRPPTLQRFPKVDQPKRPTSGPIVPNTSWTVQKGNGKVRTYRVHNAGTPRTNIVKLVQSISVIGEQRYVIVPVGVASPQPKIAIPKESERMAPHSYQRKPQTQLKAAQDIQQKNIPQILPDFRKQDVIETLKQIDQPQTLPEVKDKMVQIMDLQTVKTEHETDDENIVPKKEIEDSTNSDTCVPVTGM